MKIHRKIAAITSAALMFASTAVFNSSGASDDIVRIKKADQSGEIISGGFYTISPVLSEKYVTAQSDGTANQWASLADDSQRWQIFTTDNGYCRIMSVKYPDKSLTVENGDSTNGNKIKLESYSDLSSQHFKLNKTGDSYYITAECSGKAAFDVYGQSSENGAVIDQWDYWGGEGQKFYIRPVGGDFRFVRGDLNFDGAVDSFDRIIMQRGLISSFDETMSAIADMNGDGAVNTADLVLLTGYILGKQADIQTYSTISTEKPDVAYLFAYFLGNAPVLPIAPVFCQDRQPVQNVIFRRIQAKHAEPFRIEFIDVGKTIPLIAACPFLGQLNAFRCIKAIPIVVCAFTAMINRLFDDMI